MFLQNATNKSTNEYWANIQTAARMIQTADRILVGVGSGMTAAGGLCYTDPDLTREWYPEYFSMGDKSIVEIMGRFWPTNINEQNALLFWGFWARHINHIRFEPGTLKPYQDLFQIIHDKEYFICSTNVDGQLEKAGFSSEKIFAPQGDYALLQCQKPCTQSVYQNEEIIKKMIDHMATPFEVRKEDIPRCPKCGRLLIPNLRCDHTFVEGIHIQNREAYETILKTSRSVKLVLLELGVGFNTPDIIRYPFDTVATRCPEATLIRVNRDDASAELGAELRTISILNDAGQVLADIDRITSK